MKPFITLLFFSFVLQTSVFASVTIEKPGLCKAFSEIKSDSTISDTLLKKIAKEDASKNYSNNGEFILVLVMNFIATPLIGWIVPVSITSKPIPLEKIKIPLNMYSDNELYNKTYIKEYTKIRNGKVWGAYILSSILYIVGVFLLFKAFYDLLTGGY